MGWGYRFWVGKLYPEGTRPSGYLAEYSKAMDSVEVDATFYRIPSVSTVEAWRDSVPDGFRFAAKFPQTVTHVPGLAYDAERLEVFLRHVEAMGDRLGPLLLQFPPFLKPFHAEFDNLLEKMPRRRLIVAEFRNRGWYVEETYKLLRDHGVALALTNREGAPEVETAGFDYVRIEGERKTVNGEKGVVEVNRDAETVEWAGKIKKRLSEGRDAYVYFSKYYSGYPPHDAAYLTSILRSAPKAPERRKHALAPRR